MEYHITPEQALRNLHETLGEESIELLRLGSLSVRFYSPKGSDRQQPHTAVATAKPADKPERA